MFIAICNLGVAQVKLSGGLGIGASFQRDHMNDDMIFDMHSFTVFEHTSSQYSSIQFIEFGQHFGSKVLASFYLGRGNVEKQYQAFGSQNSTGKIIEEYTTGMVGLTVNFLNAQHIKLYSSVYLGGSFVKGNSNLPGQSDFEKFKAAGHIDLLGISLGDKIAVFGAFGYGTKGMINGGLSINF